jgi:hypothetical protein
MFEGFTLDFVDVAEATLRVRHGGSGSPRRRPDALAAELLDFLETSADLTT